MAVFTRARLERVNASLTVSMKMNLNIFLRPLGHIVEGSPDVSHPSLDTLKGHQSHLQAEAGTASLPTSGQRDTYRVRDGKVLCMPPSTDRVPITCL